MKISSNNLISHEGKPVFVLFIDTEKTGNPDQDCFYAAHDYSSFVGNENENSDKLIDMIMSMLSDLIHSAYGVSSEIANKKPLTDWHNTGFDRNYPNGIKK
jgi:hypothetical protein